MNCDIIYLDIHAKNFMIDIATETIKLIDFDSQYVRTENTKNIHYESMMTNLKNILWIKETNAESLKDIDDSDFFLKTFDNNMLSIFYQAK